MSKRPESDLQALVDDAARNNPGVLLSVKAPFLALDWQGATGTADRENDTPLRTEHGFRIASQSKTFTGVLFAQLVENRVLDLATPAVELLPEPIAATLPVADGHNVTEITLHRLLHHRAGFNDFALSQAWFNELAADPGRFREPLEIAQWAIQHGELVGPPGGQYHYSDTGFVLAGLVLEQVTGQPYAQLCRERIFDPLGMSHTWLEGHEEPRCELAHCYLDMDGDYVDALQINGSCDWAAGGHVSTLADLDCFLGGLFNGKLFKQAETLELLLRGELAKDNYHYGMGIGRKTLAGKTLWGHLGHWGSFMYWCPEHRLRIAGTLGCDRDGQNPFLGRVLETLALAP